MNKKVILSMGTPILIRDLTGRLATIEMNENECVVCRFHPNDSVYLGDVALKTWYPANAFSRLIYQFKKHKYRK